MYKRLRTLTIALIPIMLLSAGCARFMSSDMDSDKAIFLKGERLFNEGKYRKSGKQMEQLLQEFLESEYKARALFILAETQFLRKKYEEAQFNYDKFVEIHPAHPWAEKAAYRSAVCSFNKILSADRDQTYTINALEKLRAFLQKYPDGQYSGDVKDRIKFARQRLAEQELYVADYYSKTKAYDQAILRYENLLDRYSDTDSAKRALLSLARVYEKTGQKDKAGEIYKKLNTGYPRKPSGRKANDRL